MPAERSRAVNDKAANCSGAADDRAWMRGSSPLKGAILGLVLERPGHGYDLGARLRARLGPSWAIDPKRLYRMLDQLERASLISGAVESDPDNPRLQRTVYSATELAPGRAADVAGNAGPAGAHARGNPGEGGCRTRTGRAAAASSAAPV